MLFGKEKRGKSRCYTFVKTLKEGSPKGTIQRDSTKGNISVYLGFESITLKTMFSKSNLGQ